MIPGEYQRIPARAHLIWFGATLPWATVLAVRSAAVHGQLDRVTLHHDADLSSSPYYSDLLGTQGVELLKFDGDAVFGRCGRFGESLAAIFARLSSKVMRSDLLRLALLYGDGGVYLDTDTITIAALAPLCATDEAFCGQERIVFPAHVRASRDASVRAAAIGRSFLRSLLRHIPQGHRAFAHVERLYPAEVNNAILASAPGTAFITSLLEGLLALPRQRQSTLYAIGPHLLQAVAPGFSAPQLRIYPPEVFYPMGPEISAHWFRPQRKVDLASVLSPETRVVHWYGSTPGGPGLQALDPAYVRAHAGRQLWSTLVLPFA